MKINKFILKKRKCPSKSSRITNLESLWYKFMRYLWALRLSLTITLKQHNATLPKAKGEEGGREWDGWMASLIQWTWTWANSRRQWGTRRPGVLQFMGSQRVKHDLATEQQQMPQSSNDFSYLKHIWYFKNSYLVLNMHLDVMQKIVLKLISFYLFNRVLFSPFYRKENEGLWGGDAKRESWDGGLERETAGVCTATL